ncbi:MAG: hypothetical protein M1820_005097 [Bogoriella megaspora]|nr:MAG: hypothetical protein M1820_005097 [Bogoriella megaspora]
MNIPGVGPPAPDSGPGQHKKALRFITNHGQPHTKRRRISSACVTCRKRKTGCSGERPYCKTCATNNQQCGGYVTETTQSSNQARNGDANRRGSSGNADREKVVKTPTEHPPRPFPYKSPGGQGQQSPGHPSKPPPNGTVIEYQQDLETRQANAPKLTMNEHAESDEAENRSPTLGLGGRNRMPYFRYFGPTAIMPGFKQMIVKVKEHRPEGGATSSSDPGILSPFADAPGNNSTGGHQIHSATPSHMISDIRTPLAIPFYDNSRMPPSELITHLCSTFFDFLGCSFPFLQKERFMRDLEEKEVDAVLVDAVCAMAARFSQHPMLRNSLANSDGHVEKGRITPAGYGHVFAQRAKAALTDTFPCPNVAAVQAALLLAYDEFGRNRDSGLWMYLGIAIRMAQDLGMQNLNGLRYEGCDGPTPKSVKLEPGHTPPEDQPRFSQNGSADSNLESHDVQEQRAVERERLDTFWAVFFLDRVISSGTGRPVTLNDRDIEVAFPSMSVCVPGTDWPTPFPALIRIIHLYGQVTDVLNRIKEASQMTPDVLRQLAVVEAQLTHIYQGLSPRLHFNAINFQHYVKVSQGGTFVLLHFWFHTLIVLLHQPTLLHTFEGKIQQLVSNSRELSMSSAKTIADILAFAELTDGKAALANPFTSQPVYIAACAFLNETMLHTNSSNPESRAGSPPPQPVNAAAEVNKPPSSSSSGANSPKLLGKTGSNGTKSDPKQLAKHTLLATAANQNYQRCHRALENLEHLWAGTKYILTVVDQKAKGVGEPVLYTKEEMDCALERPSREPAFTSPGWRRKHSWTSQLTEVPFGVPHSGHIPGPLPPNSAMIGNNPSLPNMNVDMGNAIGWSLTGTMNSPSSSLAFLYPTANTAGSNQPMNRSPQISNGLSHTQANSSFSNNTRTSHSKNSIRNTYDTSIHSTYGQGIDTGPSFGHNILAWGNFGNSSESQQPHRSDTSLPKSNPDPYHGPLNPQNFNTSQQAPSLYRNDSSSDSQYFQTSPGGSMQPPSNNNVFAPGVGAAAPEVSHFGDVTVQSQDIDISTFGDSMMPWLEYLPQDFLTPNLDVSDATAGAGAGGDIYTPQQGESGESAGQETHQS